MTGKESILFVHYGKELGGAPKALRYLIEACKDDGYACYVACLDCSQTSPYFKEAGAKIIIVDSLPRYTNSTTVSYDVNGKEFQQEREFAAHYASYWRQIISEHGPFSLVFLNSMVLCDLIKPSRESGCKVIQTVRETAQPGSLLVIMKKIIGAADAILFISEYDQNLFSFKSTKNVVIPDAVEPSIYSCDPDERVALRKKHGLAAEDVVLLFTGGFTYIKGAGMLIESLGRLNPSGAVTVLFAGYANRKSFKAACKALLSHVWNSPRFVKEIMETKLRRINAKGRIRVRCVGFRENIETYFKMSDIVLVPYAVPHQAMPIFEAGMAKLPCLVSDFPCYQYEIEDGYNGYLLPANDPDAWVKQMENLLNDKLTREQMGLNNYRKAIERHNIHTNRDKLLLLVKAVLNS